MIQMASSTLAPQSSEAIPTSSTEPASELIAKKDHPHKVTPQQQFLDSPPSSDPAPVSDLPPIDPVLLDALRNPKEREFVLRLEKEIEIFVETPSQMRLDYPLLNSYQRLIVHRLAPMFNLAHVVESHRKAVILYRKPDTCQSSIKIRDVKLDQVVAALSPYPPSPASEPAEGYSLTGPPPRPFKIMQRDTRFRDSHGSHHYPENSGHFRGSTGHHGSPSFHSGGPRNNQYVKPIEEREVLYKEARARIFQGEDEDENDSSVGNVQQSAGIALPTTRSAKFQSRQFQPRPPKSNYRSQHSAPGGIINSGSHVFPRYSGPVSYRPSQGNFGYMGGPAVAMPGYYNPGYRPPQILYGPNGEPMMDYGYPAPQMMGLDGFAYMHVAPPSSFPPGVAATGEQTSETETDSTEAVAQLPSPPSNASPNDHILQVDVRSPDSTFATASNAPTGSPHYPPAYMAYPPNGYIPYPLSFPHYHTGYYAPAGGPYPGSLPPPMNANTNAPYPHASPNQIQQQEAQPPVAPEDTQVNSLSEHMSRLQTDTAPTQMPYQA